MTRGLASAKAGRGATIGEIGARVSAADSASAPKCEAATEAAGRSVWKEGIFILSACRR